MKRRFAEPRRTKRLSKLKRGTEEDEEKLGFMRMKQ